MEVKMQIPFQQLLKVVKTLTPAQKARLKQELIVGPENKDRQSDFTQFLLSGPVFSNKQIQIIEENRKSIAKWRTKS